MSENLIAYIPVPNRQYIEWMSRHPGSILQVIDLDIVESIMPKLNRNMIALSADAVVDMLRSRPYVRGVSVFHPMIPPVNAHFILPEEDFSHLFAERYLLLIGATCSFETICARWDMQAVVRQQPIIPDCEISWDQTDISRILTAEDIAICSPDWWRQIGALFFRDGKLLASTWNKHFPIDYETAIYGDPRINFDAGDPAGAQVYLSLHAEKDLVSSCARMGIPMMGGSVYVTTFPCADCARILAEVGIRELFFRDGYSVLKGLETLRNAGVRIVQVKDPAPT